jgi:hypothetical protein
MKTILFTLFILPFIGLSQFQYPSYSFTFDDTTHQYYLYRDTLSNPNCIWQIGAPQKTIFNNTVVNSNVIVTDTINSYPINDTSSFIIKHVVGDGYFGSVTVWPSVYIKGKYYSETDSLSDFGKIEYSPDNGITWILMSDDTLNNLWPSSISDNGFGIFTGSSGGWKEFNLELTGIMNTNYAPIALDTIQINFTFISDSNSDNLDGLMFDDIIIVDNNTLSINENINGEQTAFPNPFESVLNLSHTNLVNGSLNIFDVTGKLVYSEIINNSNTTTVNTLEFTKGIYIYKLVDTETGLSVGKGKIVK